MPTGLTEKACPVVLRHRAGIAEILCFRHPLAGMQVVKGTIEPGESPVEAACRELMEEAGIAVTGTPSSMGSSRSIAENQLWHFVRCPVGDLPESWTFHTKDDGGHDFVFGWSRIDDLTDRNDWHPIFIRALDTIAAYLE